MNVIVQKSSTVNGSVSGHGAQAGAAFVSGRQLGQLLANRNKVQRASLAICWQDGDLDVERTDRIASMLFDTSTAIIQKLRERDRRWAERFEANAAKKNGNGSDNNGVVSQENGADNHGDDHGRTSDLVENFARAWSMMDSAERMRLGQYIGPRALWDDAVIPNL
jgi:hypothetical protein